MNHCPYCNNDIVNNRCTQCDYKGPGLTTEERTQQYRDSGSPKLGDLTGDPQNNGWADGPYNSD